MDQRRHLSRLRARQEYARYLDLARKAWPADSRKILGARKTLSSRDQLWPGSDIGQSCELVRSVGRVGIGNRRLALRRAGEIRSRRAHGLAYPRNVRVGGRRLHRAAE